MDNRIIRLLKHNPLTVYTYNKILDYRCRNVKAYIFVATTGRSGSKSLSKIFQAVDNAACFHEPHPNMMLNYPPGTDKEAYLNNLFKIKKRTHIKRASIGHSYYVETNHLFVKNFISQAIEYFGDKIKIIHLRREPINVARSFYQLDSIPGKPGTGKLYLINPNEEKNIIKIADLLNGGNEFNHDLYKCLWYWYELETRCRMMKQKYSHIPFYQLRTEDLNNKDALLRMFRKLDVPVEPSKLAPLIALRANTKFDEKTRKIDIDIEKCKYMHDKLLKRMEERYGKGFWL